jgi:hypothetical protein
MSFSTGKPTLRNVQITTPDILQAKIDTKANLVTFATTAADGCLCYASNEDKMYVVNGGALEEVIKANSSGNVGIGTSSPSGIPNRTLLNIRGTSSTAEFRRGQLIVESFDGLSFISVASDTGAGNLPSIDGSSGIIFRTSTDKTVQGTERMRIDASGNVGIGSATLVTDARVTITRAAGVGNEPPLGLVHGAYSHKVGPNATGAFMVYRASDNVGVYLTYGNTAWSATSDERKKDIIEPIVDGLNKVSSLRSVIGKYKHDDIGVRRSFIIAQDVQVVLPEAVNVQADEDGTLGVSYTDLIPLLVSALKDVKAELDSAKARIAALENA